MKTKGFVLALIGVLVYAGSAKGQEPATHHHFELSIGEPISPNFMFSNSAIEEKYFSEWKSKSRPVWPKGYEDEWGMPTISASYYFQIYEWLSLGVEVSVMSQATVEKQLPDDKMSAYYLITNLHVAPGIRFTYYYNSITELYSGIMWGMLTRFHSTESKPVVMVNTGNLTGQITAMGVRFGKQVYGNVEVGFGYKGILSAGIGYRF